jgi:monoamine oxidase
MPTIEPAGAVGRSPISFRGQVAERGGEFIDTPHKTLLGYIREFKLAVEDVDKQLGEVFYYFDGEHYPESRVVDEYRAFVPAMRNDLRTLSGEPTAADHTPADEMLDRTSLKQYLESRGAGPLIKSVIEQAYKAEYGSEIDEQSCLNFLLFIHADRRSKFTPFGVFSDERYHVVRGNDRIVEGLSNGLPGQLQLGMRLVRARKTAAGRIEIAFAQGATIKEETFEAVVLALPFTTLREVDLDPSLGLPDSKRNAITSLGYGTNAKMMIGFNGRPWLSLGSNGEAYSDLSHHQLTWETNPIRASASRGVLTDYSSGRRGATLNPNDVQNEANLFLLDLDNVIAGALASAAKRQWQYPCPPRALAVQSAFERFLYLLPPGTVYLDRRQRRDTGRQPLLCRRACEFFLRVAGLYGRRGAFRNPDSTTNPSRHQSRPVRLKFASAGSRFRWMRCRRLARHAV